MAAAVKVLSAGAVRRGVTEVAQRYESASGVRVEMDFSSAPKVRARVAAGERADVVIASSVALDALAQESRITGDRATLGRSRMVVMIRKGAAAPDLSSTQAFVKALVDADFVLNNQGSSGIYAEKLIDRLALRAKLGDRFRTVQNGNEMVQILESHAGHALGLAQISNLIDQVGRGRSVELAGFFPDEIQNGTLYQAALASGSAEVEPAAGLVRAFESAEARKLLAASGLD